MSRLVKGRCVNLDREAFVYHIPAYPVAVPGQEEAEAVAPGRDYEAEENALYAAVEAQRRKAREIMQEAEQFSDSTRAAAARQAAELREQARREGYQRGYEQGKFQALAENEEILERLKRVMEDLDRGREALIRQNEQKMVDLALEIARKVVADRIEQDDESFLRIFKKAVEGLSGQKIVRLSISEHEIEFATAHADYLRSLVQDAEKLEIQVIEGAAQGTMIVDTEDVSIDASVEKQMEVLEQSVEDARFVRNS